MHVSTILSRRVREQSKSLTRGELLEKVKESKNMAIQWMTIPGGSQQANKYWDAVSYYEKMLGK
jgi:hypothetical protein